MEIIWGFPLKPQKVELFAGGSTATKHAKPRGRQGYQRIGVFWVPYPVQLLGKHKKVVFKHFKQQLHVYPRSGPNHFAAVW